MSEPVDFEGSNFTYLGPEGKQCYDLHVFKHSEGVSFCIRFTPEEIEQVVRHGVVWVNMRTHSVPMLLVTPEPLVHVPDGNGGMRPSKPEPAMPRARIGGLAPKE